MHKEKIHIGVRDMVEFVLRRGDINIKYTSSKRGLKGIKIHQKIQKEHKKKALLKGYDYLEELSIKYSFEYNEFIIDIDGRIDGIVEAEKDIYIEEIKSCSEDVNNIIPDYKGLHFAQAICYGYIYAEINKIEKVNIVLTYCQLETYEKVSFEKEYNYNDLRDYFYNIIELYYYWIKLKNDFKIIRNESIKNISFPYSVYRKGQREFAGAVYKTIVSNKKLFAQAPTGTGKTISVLFPAIKHFLISDNSEQKIFYLTAKTTTRKTAEDTLLRMYNMGLKLKTVIITAKDKICFCSEKICTPQKCKYADGHFDRINNALKDILKNEDMINSDIIEIYAKKHMVCPFEFSFDIAIYSDCIICDYNYVFDPKVQMKRFFSDESKKLNHIILVDEAHNLVERSREMYSASIDKNSFKQAKNSIKARSLSIYKSLEKINNYMQNLYDKFDIDDNAIVTDKYPEELVYLLMDFASSADKWLVNNELNKSYDKIIDLYFTVLDFIRISELFDSHYLNVISIDKDNINYKLLCLDTSYLLALQEKKLLSSIFFSATFSPIDYFMDILGGTEEDNFIKIPSPFNPENLCLIIDASISTKYNNRHLSYEKISDRLFYLVNAKKGNYIAFFPSYDYMNKVYDVFRRKYKNINTIIQMQSFDEKDKQNYISNFDENNKESLIGFAVLGGIFSEGVDLSGNKLIGTAVIGVGLPLISFERNIILNYYNQKNNKGFEYAYIYPGMNKVFQASGRVIRKENDCGINMLIDNRFLNYEYKKLFPYEWNSYKAVYSEKMIIDELNKFWNKVN